jgi:hypothetical protein
MAASVHAMLGWQLASTPYLYNSIRKATLRKLLGTLHEDHDLVVVDEGVDGIL